MAQALIDDDLWIRIEPLLPKRRARNRQYAGRRPLPDRAVLTGILFVRRSGRATTEPEDPAEKDTADPSVFRAVEALVKGLEVPLPPGETFIDKDGHRRDRARVRWWDGAASTYRDGVLGPLQRETLPFWWSPATASTRCWNDSPSGSRARITP